MSKWYRHPLKKNSWISKEEYFKILFGDEYMESTDKGTLKEYQEKPI